MNGSDILNIKEPYEEDDSIRSYQYYQYSPITGTNLNSPGEIRITIESQDEYFHPANSYLLITGKLVKDADGSNYAAGDNVSLINNAMMYLFSTIKYELSAPGLVRFKPNLATHLKLKFTTKPPTISF